ncbi:hypothetical protein [Weissella oryzae]|nr:hypothetical protein [Weissella oryzae]
MDDEFMVGDVVKVLSRPYEGYEGTIIGTDKLTHEYIVFVQGFEEIYFKENELRAI